MTFVLFTVAITVAFLVGSLILLHFGRVLGLRYLTKQKGNIAGLGTIEGAVFALIGLLLAFTISGALARFDDRRQLVTQEADAVTTAYDRIDLFEPAIARDLHAKLKEYVAARIALYDMSHDFAPWKPGVEIWPPEQIEKITALKNTLWDAAVAACPENDFRPACGPALTALNEAFEVARLRIGAAEKHPPQIVYVLLFGLSLSGALLAGFGMGAAGARSRVHMVAFAGALAVTLYVVTDMEFPRTGVFRVDTFDHFLIEAYDQMR
jgi:hypothetical protein